MYSFCRWHTQPKALRRELILSKATGPHIPWVLGPQHQLSCSTDLQRAIC